MAAVIDARARGMVVGNIIGDAAAVPNHWIYDVPKMDAHVKSASRGPAFCEPAGNGFYKTSAGGQSCYGDQTLCLLESLVACKGYDENDYAKKLVQRFGKESSYELEATDQDNWPELKVNPVDENGQVDESRRLWSLPLPGPWRHGSIKAFLTNFVTEGRDPKESGGDEQSCGNSIDGVCKVPPLVALFAGDPCLLPAVARAVRVTQNADTAVAFSCGFARILENMVLGRAGSVQEACQQTREVLRDPEREFPLEKDADVEAALALVEDMATIPMPDVGSKMHETLQLKSATSAIA